MLFSSRFWPGIQDGSVTLTFRRWRRPQAVAGRPYRTPAGRIAVDACEIVNPASINDDDARQAGFESADALRGELRGDPALPVYRVAFRRLSGPDPRDVLATDPRLSPAELATVATQLTRLDASSASGPWTEATLRAIAIHPGTRAAGLAALLGRETLSLKADIRKLKTRGLTISLETGYRISPRGEAVLAWLDSRNPAGLNRSPS